MDVVIKMKVCDMNNTEPPFDFAGKNFVIGYINIIGLQIDSLCCKTPSDNSPSNHVSKKSASVKRVKSIIRFHFLGQLIYPLQLEEIA